jgi:AcrR family transcriptional regulator
MNSFAKIHIKVNEKLYLRDPEQTELGRKIIQYAIKMIDIIGFEQFTFKKLAKEIHSTEASVYRYFENKHKLLIYIVSWYWSWLEYQIDYQTNNIKSAEHKLKIAIKTLSEATKFDPEFSHIDEVLLHKIVVAESSKSYLTKEVDQDNKDGYFISYKSLCNKIVGIVKEFNPEFPYPRALVSTIIEAAHQQKFFSEHLPSLTEIKKNQPDEQISNYLEFLAIKLIKP